MITAIFTIDKQIVTQGRSLGGAAAPEQHRPRGGKPGGKMNILNVKM